MRHLNVMHHDHDAGELFAPGANSCGHDEDDRPITTVIDAAARRQLWPHTGTQAPVFAPTETNRKEGTTVNNALNGPGLQHQAEQAVGDPMLATWRQREYERQALVNTLTGRGPRTSHELREADAPPEQEAPRNERRPDPSQGRGMPLPDDDQLTKSVKDLLNVRRKHS